MSERAFVRSEFFIGEIIFFRSIFLIMLMSHMRYNVERDLVDFWERMVYDNVVNQSTHTNKYKNTTKSSTQSIKELDKQSKGNRQQQKRSIDTPTFQGRGSKTQQHRTIYFALTGNL